MTTTSQVVRRAKLRARRVSLTDLRRRPLDGDPPLPGRGERVLAREAMPDGGHVIATNHALYVRATEPSPQVWRQIGWGDVRAVGRSSRPHQESVMTLRLRTPSFGQLVLALTVRKRSRVPALACQLAAEAVVATRFVVLSNSAAVTYLARRDPNTSGVTWTVEFQRACDQQDPDVRREVAMTLHEIRVQLGC